MSNPDDAVVDIVRNPWEALNTIANLGLEKDELKRELEHLRAGGCARDQKATRYCWQAENLARELEVCKDAWINNVKATDLVREQRDELSRELERVKIALANAISERDAARAMLECARNG